MMALSAALRGCATTSLRLMGQRAVHLSAARLDVDEGVVGAVSNILYNVPKPTGDVEKHTLSILMENEPGVLSRVSGLLSGRGVNINSLTVAETETKGLSRMTVSIKGRANEVLKTAKQIDDIEETLAVLIFTPGTVIEREVVLVKFDTTVEGDYNDIQHFEMLSNKRNMLMSLAKLFNAAVVDVGSRAMTLELTSWPRRVDAFINFAAPYGIIETARSGVVATGRSSVASYQDLEVEEEMMDVSQLPPS